MSCKYPITIYTGKKSAAYPSGIPTYPMKNKQIHTVPCGTCWNCRAYLAQQWTARITQEASLYKDNSFITLTYKTSKLPKGGTLVKDDFQNFLKRLRKNNPELNIRYYQCGEYGDKMGRAHYHAILFGVKFKDQKFWKTSKSGNKLYRSKILEKSWKLGHSYIGNVKYESIAYVARYAMKKITGEPAKDHYKGRLPEYTTMSLKPAIGLPYYDINKHSMFEKGTIPLNGRDISIPRFYRRKYEIDYPERYQSYIDSIKIKSQSKTE